MSMSRWQVFEPWQPQHMGMGNLARYRDLGRAPPSLGRGVPVTVPFYTKPWQAWLGLSAEG